MPNSPGRLKILMLPKWYPNRFDVLDGVFVVDHIQSIASRHDVAVLFVHNDPELIERRKIFYSEEHGFKEWIVYFRCSRTGFGPVDKLLIGLAYLRTQFLVWKKIKAEWGKPDLTQVHVLLRSAFLALWLNLINKIPLLITEHWSGYDNNVGYKISRVKRWFIRLAFRKAFAITVVSNYLKLHVSRFCDQKKIFVIPNACNEKLFHRAGISGHGKKQMLHVSTLDDYPKNFGNILRATAVLHKERSDFVLHVIGKGVEQKKQEQLAKELGVLNVCVFFYGYLPKAEVAKWMSDSDVFILFSHYETQSCVVIEALLSGVPVIAPKLGGVQELITAENGILVEPGNVVGFCDAIRQVLDGEVTFSEEVIRKSALKFGYVEVGEQFHDIFDRRP